MSLTSLVQVGSRMWLDPAGIIGVRWVTPLTGMHAGYSQVIYRDDNPYIQNTVFLESDWPIERVQSALGLVSADDLEGML